MGILYITEYVDVAALGGMPSNLPVEPGVTQKVTYTTTTQSTAFATSTKIVRIHTDSICSIEFGTSPTATTNSRRMIAGATEYFAVPPGSAYKVAAVTNT